jgi:hypothetical protein
MRIGTAIGKNKHAKEIIRKWTTKGRTINSETKAINWTIIIK